MESTTKTQKYTKIREKESKHNSKDRHQITKHEKEQRGLHKYNQKQLAKMIISTYLLIITLKKR